MTTTTTTTTATIAVATVRRVARAYAWRWGLDADDVAGAALLRLVESGADMAHPGALVRATRGAAVDAVRRRDVRLRYAAAHPPVDASFIDPTTMGAREVWAALGDAERLCALTAGAPGMGAVATALGVSPWRASRIARSVRDRLVAAA